MFKEAVICIVIVISIFTLNNITQSYTEEKSNLLKEDLNNIKELILSKKEDEEVLNSIKKLENDWKDMNSKMAFYIEHDELEKVETDFTTLRSYVEMGDSSMAVSMIDESTFIIEHIIDKNKFTLKNIF